MSEDKSLPRKEKERNEPKPITCPLCGLAGALYYATEWFAHSLDPSDIFNVGQLHEYGCHNCARSFWV